MEIKPYANNAKEHPTKQLKQIAASLRRFGWQQPIKVGLNGVILVGHGRYMAYKKFPDGIETPWIIDENGKTISGGPSTKKLTEEEEIAYRLADNKLNESKWIMELVKDDLRILPEEMIELTGFDKDLIIDPDEKDDAIPENVPAVSKLGDIYELGCDKCPKCGKIVI